tara:strand:- start:9435 stop:10244 length:810 start_codon:yes stop_codon:yes gene_type:complete
MSSLLVGYLTYVTEKNKNRRFENFSNSLDSLNQLKDKNCDLVSIDNNSSSDIKKIIESSGLFSKIVHLDKNFYDISVIFITAYLSKKLGYDYCMYMYDDFVVTKGSAIIDCIKFLDIHSDVHCMRTPIYEYENKKAFDPDYTPKNINPDAVRHFNTATGEKLRWKGPYFCGNSKFFINNWHYTSRPTIWRTDVLYSLFENMEDIPVMQTFEGYSCTKLNELPLVVGVIDGGIMHTVKQSERNEQGGTSVDKKIRIKRSEILKCLDRLGF